MTSNVLLCDSVACFVNGNFCFTRSQQLIPVEKSLYLVKTEFASVQVRRVRRLEKKIYSIFTKKVPQGSFCESPVMKWTVIHYNSITPFKENRTIPPRYFRRKKNKSSLPLEAPSSIFTKSTPRQECKRFIVKVALDADLWISKAGVPVIEFSYRLFIVVFVTLASSKKWIVLTTKSLT